MQRYQELSKLGDIEGDLYFTWLIQPSFRYNGEESLHLDLIKRTRTAGCALITPGGTTLPTQIGLPVEAPELHSDLTLPHPRRMNK